MYVFFQEFAIVVRDFFLLTRGYKLHSPFDQLSASVAIPSWVRKVVHNRINFDSTSVQMQSWTFWSGILRRETLKNDENSNFSFSDLRSISNAAEKTALMFA